MKDYWRQHPIVENAKGSHRQIINVGQDLFSSSLDLNSITNLTNGEIENLEAHNIGQFKGQLVVVNENELLLKSKQGWLRTPSPVKDGYSVFCLQQIGEYLIVATDKGYLSAYTLLT